MNIRESIEFLRAEAKKFPGNAEAFFRNVAEKYPTLAQFLRTTYAVRDSSPFASKSFRDIFAVIASPPPRADLGATPAKPAPARPAPAPKAAPVSPAVTVESIGREVLQLATSPNEKVSQPVIKGIAKSLSAQAMLDAKVKEIRHQPGNAREKLAALKDLKHSAQMAEHAAHQERCAQTRDKILAAMRARMAGKKV